MEVSLIYINTYSIGHPDIVIVTWLTFDDTAKSHVEYATNLKLNNIVKSEITRFVDGGKKKTVRYIHRVTLNNIQPGQRYCKSK